MGFKMSSNKVLMVRSAALFAALLSLPLAVRPDNAAFDLAGPRWLRRLRISSAMAASSGSRRDPEGYVVRGLA
jgi:hypothetical protein